MRNGQVTVRDGCGNSIYVQTITYLGLVEVERFGFGAVEKSVDKWVKSGDLLWDGVWESKVREFRVLTAWVKFEKANMSVG